MSNIFKVKVTRQGSITLPKELRNQYHIQEGDTYFLTGLGNGMFLMSRRKSQVDELADQIAAQWESSGESLESMLSALSEVREAFYSEDRAG